jgi:hypothetical protein
MTYETYVAGPAAAAAAIVSALRACTIGDAGEETIRLATVSAACVPIVALLAAHRVQEAVTTRRKGAIGVALSGVATPVALFRWLSNSVAAG